MMEKYRSRKLHVPFLRTMHLSLFCFNMLSPLEDTRSQQFPPLNQRVTITKIHLSFAFPATDAIGIYARQIAALTFLV
jgi:hypothetical protein